MAVTKIHPIKKTLHLALNYIMNADKTDEKSLFPLLTAILSLLILSLGRRKENVIPRQKYWQGI